MSPHPSELYSDLRLHMSSSEGGSGSLFMAVQKCGERTDFCTTKCVLACVWAHASTCVTDILVSSVSMGHGG